MKNYILSLDQGTTSSRAVLYDTQGKAVSIGQQPLSSTYPSEGLVEQDPEEIWRTQLSAARQAISEAKVSSTEIAAIGIANQRETTILWDADSGEPLCPAIVWQCRRSAPICARLRDEGLESFFIERTGLVLDAYFSGTKIRWAMDNVDVVRNAASAGKLRFGTVDSWLVWKLTGGSVHVTDVSNASRTLLLDLEKAGWDEQCLEHLDIPPDILPEVKPSSEVLAETSLEIFDARIPIAGIAGDQQAALFGQLALSTGEAKCTYGTGCFILANLGKRRPGGLPGLLGTIAWQRGSELTYAMEGSVFMGGAVVQWLRDKMELIPDAVSSASLAASVSDTGGVYLVPAFVGLGAPHWDMYARGLLAGMTQATSRAHVVRAALEGIAFQVQDVVSLLTGVAGMEIPSIRVDGGACRNDFLMQFQADLLGFSVERPVNIETTSLGAAFLAGLAVGFWKGEEDLKALVKLERCFEPAIDVDQRQGLIEGWKRAVERAKGWVVPDTQ